MKDPHSKIKITKKPTSGGPDGGKTIRPPKRSGTIVGPHKKGDEWSTLGI